MTGGISELSSTINGVASTWSRMFVIRLTGLLTLKLKGYEK